jgi:WD40 repeat protein
VGFGDGTVVLADAATGKELRHLKLADSVNSLALSPDGKILAAGTQGEELHLVDPATVQPIRALKGHGRPIRSVAFSPDGKRLVSGSMDMTVRVWEIE